MTANGSVKFDGEKIKLGEQEFVIPSLTVGQAKRLWPSLLELNKGVTVETFPEKLDDMMAIIYAAISRNYPEIKREDLEELIDMRNVKGVLMAIAQQSGIGKPEGEKQPAAAAEENPLVQ